MITPQQLRDTADAMEAHQRGEPIESRQWGIADEWVAIKPPENPYWAIDRFIYRPKPKPKTRPWSKPEDVPSPVCWITAIGCDDANLIVSIQTTGIYFGACDEEYEWDTLQDMQYSIDRKTWHPCTVEE